MQVILSFFSSLTLSIDLLVILGVFILFILYFCTLGKEDVVTAIKAIYISAFPIFFFSDLFSLLPTFGVESGFLEGGYFLVFFLITFFILTRNGFFESPMVPALWETGVFATLAAGLFVVILARLSGGVFQADLSELTNLLFISQPGSIFWVVAPIGFWLLIRGDD